MGKRKVWVVVILDCESMSIKAICSTKEIAIAKMFEARDGLVKEWKESIGYWKEKGCGADDMYQRMVDAISSDDYEKWDNYPHETPRTFEMEVVEELPSPTKEKRR